MHTALDIANFFIQLSNSIPDDYVDNLKLNKLLYFAQGWSLAINAEPLFKDDFEAWDHGPVIRTVYDTYKPCGRAHIEEPSYIFDESLLSNKELEILADVYLQYGQYTGVALRNMSHQKGSPWESVYIPQANVIIEKNAMKNYFKKQKLNRFSLNPEALDVITKVPSSWDTPEDEVYDGV